MFSSKTWFAALVVLGGIATLQGCGSEEPTENSEGEEELNAAVACPSFRPSACETHLDCKLETAHPPTPPKCVPKTCEDLQATNSKDRTRCGKRLDCKVVFGSPPTPPRCETKACEDFSAANSKERGLCQQRPDCRVVYSSPPTPPRCETEAEADPLDQQDP